MAMILKTVPPGRGAHWVRDGLRLYLKRPLAFTSLFGLFFFVVLFAALLPLVGGVLQIMLVPLLSLGFMSASQSALTGGPVGPAQFVQPLRGSPQQRRDLLLLCVLYGLLVAASLLLADLVANNGFTRAMELMRKPNAQAELDALLADRSMVAGALFGSTALTLITIPFWHAPALVHWAHQGVAQSLFSSVLAMWRCRGAFLVYGLTWFALMMGVGVASALVFGLLGIGQLVAVPLGLFLSTLFYVSLIFTFNDSFGMH